MPNVQDTVERNKAHKCYFSLSMTNMQKQKHLLQWQEYFRVKAFPVFAIISRNVLVCVSVCVCALKLWHNHSSVSVRQCRILLSTIQILLVVHAQYINRCQKQAALHECHCFFGVSVVFLNRENFRKIKQINESTSHQQSNIEDIFFVTRTWTKQKKNYPPLKLCTYASCPISRFRAVPSIQFELEIKSFN